jgi:hypothetical protein
MQWQDAIHSGSGGDQSGQRLLCPDDHLAGDLSQRRRKPDELNGVAQTVIAAHEHAFIGRRLASLMLQAWAKSPARIAAIQGSWGTIAPSACKGWGRMRH